MSTTRWLLALSCCLVTPACGTIESDLCDYKCDCEGCSDREYDDCRYKYDDKYDDADRRGCLDRYDDLLSCEDDTGQCRGDGAWETSCKGEREDLDRCLK